MFYHAHLRAAVCSDVSPILALQITCQTFRFAADAGLEACLEEGLVVAFAALAVDLLSGDFFTLDAGVLEAGFFPITP